MTTAIAKWETPKGPVEVTPKVVRQLFNCEFATDFEIFKFTRICAMHRLNPFLGEVYLIKYSQREPAQIVLGRFAFAQRAEKNPDYDGVESGVIVADKDGIVHHRTGTFHMPNEELVGGWSKVYRKSWGRPVEKSVMLREFIQYRKDGKPTRFWETMPGVMIEKVALCHGYREAFPGDFVGLYGAAEMGVELNEVEIPEVDDDDPLAIEPPRPVEPAPVAPEPPAEAPAPPVQGDAPVQAALGASARVSEAAQGEARSYLDDLSTRREDYAVSKVSYSALAASMGIGNEREKEAFDGLSVVEWIDKDPKRAYRDAAARLCEWALGA